MNEVIRITEDKLHTELKRFNNKNITISFSGYIAENIILPKIKVNKKDFTIIIRSKATDELFCIDLSDISDIKKSINNNIIYIFSETVGKIKIEIKNRIYATI